MRTPLDQKAGLYDPNGDLKKGEWGMKPREYVEEQTKQANNVLWEIDEIKTAELMLQREANIVKNAKEKKRSQATQGDLIEAIGNLVAPGQSKAVDNTDELESLKAQLKQTQADLVEANKPKEAKESVMTGEPSESWSVEQLQKYCDDKGITYHHLAKSPKLLELINESK
jgi:hypothetical protein